MYNNYSKKIEIAQYYVLKGFSVFPCHSHENGVCSCGDSKCTNVAKHPLTAHGVNDATKDDEQIAMRFGGEYDQANIAIATGEPSGVWILDDDDIVTLNRMKTHNPTLPKTWKAKTGKGYHYYFRFNENCKNFKNAVKFSGGLDVRTTGGYALLPPSKHASGVEYQWIVSPDECEVADAPQWIIDLIPKHESKITESTKTSTSSIPKTDSVELSLPRCGNVNEQPPANSNSITIGYAKSVQERLKLYLEKTPPARKGERGHDVGFAVACRCVELFGGLSDTDILTELEVWNERCIPPFESKKLRHKLTDARKKTKPIESSTTTSESETSDPIETKIDCHPTLDESAYHGIVGEILHAIEPETEADIVGVLLSFLCAFGNAVGKTPHVNVGASRHNANLNVSLTGDTASGKGQAWDICKRLMSSDEDWLQSSIAYGLASGEGLVERISDPIDADTLTIPEQKRLMCLETEFARPITAMRREGNTLSPLLRSAWDGGTLEIMTRGKSKLRASNAHVSVLAHVTIEELQKLLKGSIEIVNGFGNRFLWTLVRSSKSLPHGGNVSVLNPFTDRLKTIIPKSKLIGEVKRSEEADKLWESVYAGLKESKPGTWGKSVERGRPYVVRLSLIYALLDCSPIIESHHLQAALAVWRYCEESAFAIFSDDDLTLRLRSLINQKPGIMKTELRQAVSHSIKTDVFDSALRWLIQRGDVVSVPIYEQRQAETFYPGIRTIQKTDSVELSSPLTRSVNDIDNEQHPSASNTIIDSIITTTATMTESESKLETITKPATLTELINWKNANGVTFKKREDESIWVTNDDIEVPPSIAASFNEHRDTIAQLIPQTIASVDEEVDAFEIELYGLGTDHSDAEIIEEIKALRLTDTKV